ncbi:MAG: MFS transporter [Anaerolineae bacterium]|nr:MFS transporter [Anaerolineae bacterium]
MIKAQRLSIRLGNRLPFYYGWVIWGAATLGIIATAPGQSFTVSLFIDHFIADFGLDRTTVSSLYSLGTFIGALSLTWVGRKIDQYGNRRGTLVIAALFAVALSLWSSVGGIPGLLVGFIAIRGLGQGSLSLSSSTLIAQWFRYRRGFMMSLSLIAFALFQRFYVPWLQSILEIYDWRQVWPMLSLGVALLVLPLTWLLVRDRPEDMGLLPDGAVKEVDDSAAKFDDEDNWTLREAMRTPIFWVFIGARLLPPAWATGLILHQLSLFESLGHGPHVAAEVYGNMALITAGVSLIAGYIVDRWRPGRALTLQLVGLIGAMYMATFMFEGWQLLIYALSLGVVMGSGGAFDGAVWANLFGRKYQGSIRGFATTGMVAGSAIGPVIFSLNYDLAGNYETVLWLGIGLTAIAIILSLLVPEPGHRSESNVVEQHPAG